MGIISGWLGKVQQEGPAELQKMVEAATGYAGAEIRTCILDSTALGGRILSLQQADNICTAIEGQPHWKDQALRELATKAGHAQALLEGYRRHGKSVLQQLHGTFALAILEADRKRALLAIDRVGIRPLAYTLSEETLIFGSQAFSLLAHPAVTPRIDPQGIFNYLYFHMVPSPGTIFRDIHKLQPGELLEYEDGRISREFYWQIQFSEQSASRATLSRELHEQLRQAVDHCRNGERETGAFLSGGLDSSTVVGVLQGLQSEKVDAYAIGFDAEGFDEMEYARATARHFDVSLHEYYVTPQDVLDAIPLATHAYDEPFGNASAIPAYFCAKAAREDGRALLLAGDGGDEIFAGNARYAKQKVFDFYNHVPAILKAALIEPLANKLPPLRKLKSYIDQAKVPMPQRMETYNFLHRFALPEIFSPEFLAQVDGEAPIRYLQAHYERAGDVPLVKKMLFLDHKFTLADNDLRKVNRMCELAGIEVRYPLLQDEMMEFAARVPADMLLKRLELRSFYRHAMKGFLAKETLEKHKHGFGLPFGLWMNEYPPLKAFAHDNLENIRKRGILNDDFIGRIIEAQETGHATYYGVFIWVLIMLEQWLETHRETAGLTI
jgi:asparagine synthase (glutamine-hydrolysing)